MIANSYLFDQAKAERCFGGQELMGDLLGEFLPEVESRLEGLHAAARQGDREQIHQALHWLRGGLSFLFSPAAEGVCLRLAEQVNQVPMAPFEDTLEELAMVVVCLRAHLAAVAKVAA